MSSSPTTRCSDCGNERPGLQSGDEAAAACPHCGSINVVTTAADAGTLLSLETATDHAAGPGTQPPPDDGTLLNLSAGAATTPQSEWDDSNADTRHIGTKLMAAEAAIDSLRKTGNQRHAIGAEIARGGMGAILSTTDQHLRREVAMKILLPGAAKDPDRLQRFIEEAQVTGQLDHPNVVPVHDLGVLPDGRLYFTMKLVRGQSLSHIVRRLRDGDAAAHKRFAIGHRMIIFRQICLAMAFAHSRGVVHRDLKPDNIMVGDYGEVLVMDWGLARIGGHPDRTATRLVISNRAEAGDDPESGVARTLDGTVAGTPADMPPEQAAGNVNEIDERSDIWAMGAILFELLAWRPPFEGHTWSILQAVRTTSPVWPGEHATDPPFPRELQAIVRKAMQRDKRDRYATTHDLIADVEAFQEGRMVGAASYTTRQLIGKWLARHRAAVIPSAVGLLALLVVGVWFLVSTMQHSAEIMRYATAVEEQRNKAQTEADEADRQRAAAMHALEQSNRNLAEAFCARAQQALDQHDTLAATVLLTRAHELAPDSLRVRALALARPRPVATFDRRLRAFGPGVNVHACGFRADGRLVVADEHAHLAPAVPLPYEGWEGGSVRFGPGAQIAYTVTRDGELQQIDTRSGEPGQQWTNDPAGADGRFVRILTVGDDGNRIAVSTLGAVHLIDLQPPAHRVIPLPTGEVAIDVALQQDGSTLIATTRKLLHVAADDTRQEWATSDTWITALAYHRSGDFAFVRNYSALSTMTTTGALPVRTSDLAFSPDGKLLALACADGTARLLNAATAVELAVLPGHGRAAESLAFSDDGLQLAVGADDGTVTVWNIHSPPDRPMHPDPRFEMLEFSPDGRLVIGSAPGLSAMPLPVFDATTGEEAMEATIGRFNTPTSLLPDGGVAQLGQDGRLLMLSHGDADPQLIDLGDSGVRRMMKSPDGRWLLTESSSPRLIDLRDGSARAVLTEDARFEPRVALHPDGHHVALLGAGDEMNRLEYRDADTPGAAAI